MAHVGADGDTAAIGHRLDAIHEQASQHLQRLALVEVSAQRVVHVDVDLDAAGVRDWSEQRRGVLDHLAHAHVASLKRLATREVEQPADDGGHLARLFLDDASVVLDVVGRRLVHLDHHGAARNHVERRAELVADARRDLGDRAESVGAPQLLEHSGAVAALTAVVVFASHFCRQLHRVPPELQIARQASRP